MKVLEVKNLEKSYGNLSILKDISFSLCKGEVLSIIGSSGSGKTTLLRCLNFLEQPQNGQIFVNNQLMWNGSRPAVEGNASLRKMRLHFGLVFQSFNLFPQYTALENVVLPMDLLDQTAARQKKQRLNKSCIHDKNLQYGMDLLKKMDLSDKFDSYPCQLSGGQQQRVAIARALALKPDILCFDEPTSALDPELTGTVQRVIRQLKDGKTTMIVVTHDMEFARNISDRVIFMSDGVIEEEGTPQQIFDSPESQKIKAFLASQVS